MQKDEIGVIPDMPGVYLFKKGRVVLYVGKATSLRDRVRSYFDDDLISTRGPRIVDMVTKADKVVYETTPTVLEALVKESVLIKKHQPKANVEGKDDKSFLYVGITDEDFPRVITVRGKDIDSQKNAYTNVFGPFPSGGQLRVALRIIRRIFPFFDTNYPIGEGGKHQRAKIEFNIQIGQYPKNIDPKTYRRSIRSVKLFLAGRGKELRANLEKEMHTASKAERFEDALTARRQLFALNHIQDVALIKDELGERTQSGVRIEAYDTAHLSGTNTIGVMTVLEDGVPSKKLYRTFKIRSAKNDDIASLREMLSRRLGHPEWTYPDALIVDGSMAHKKTAQTVLREFGLQIPVVAVVKDERHRPREVIGARLARVTEADAVLANSEAHRFSLARHRQARRRAIK